MILENITGRDNQIISQALLIAIPIMLRYSLSSSDTLDMLRILEQRGLSHYPDTRVKEYLDPIVKDLKNGVTFELEKNKKDGKKTSHFEKELKTYLGKYASALHKDYF